jgi:nucleoside-diphosphate-sugar epimerase
MRILIVGGSSSLAHSLKPILSKFSEVITAGREGCDVYLDLSDPLEKIVIPSGIDTVINTAAHFGGKNIEEMLQAENVNVLGALKLCHASHNAQIKHIINISSIFANLESTSDHYNFYAISKKQSDEVVQMFCSTFNLLCTILRPSQLYGNEDRFRKHQPFLYDSIDKADRDEDITIYGSGNALRNYIHVNDLSKVISLVVRDAIEGLYTCTNPIDVSLSQLANAAIGAFNSNSKIIFLNDMKKIQDNIFIYNDLLYKKIKYFPQIHIEEGLKMVAAYRLSQL